MQSSLWALALVPVLVAAGCSRPTDPQTTALPAPLDPLSGLQLDGGKRWSSDDHTRMSLASMSAAVKAAGAEMEPARTAALGRQLQQLGNELISGCTMQGRDHDALHVYLGALLPRLQTMTSDDANAALTARKEVGAILARFPDYFQ